MNRHDSPSGRLPATGAFFLVLAALVAIGLAATAAPVRDRILEKVRIDNNGDHLELEITLSFVFAYRMHFPTGSGRELRIWLRPAQVAEIDRSALGGREAVTPPRAGEAGIDEVVYEGDASEGPWITVYFDDETRYRVVPLPDYRRLKIIIEP